jgi:hypothetical protein
MKKTLTFELPLISVEVEAKEGMSQVELRELGEKEVIKQLTKKFKLKGWSIAEGAVIPDEDLVVGRPVKLKSNGKAGLIYEIKHSTKFPIRVLVEGFEDMQCTQGALETVSKNTSIDKFIKGRAKWELESDEWMGIRSAFFVNGQDIIPVILNAKGRSKMKAYIVGHDSKGNYYSLSASNIMRVFDTKPEAEAYIAKTISK